MEKHALRWRMLIVCNIFVNACVPKYRRNIRSMSNSSGGSNYRTHTHTLTSTVNCIYFSNICFFIIHLLFFWFFFFFFFFLLFLFVGFHAPDEAFSPKIIYNRCQINKFSLCRQTTVMYGYRVCLLLLVPPPRPPLPSVLPLPIATTGSFLYLFTIKTGIVFRRPTNSYAPKLCMRAPQTWFQCERPI